MRTRLAALLCLLGLPGCAAVGYLDPGYLLPAKRHEHVADATEAFASSVRWGRFEAAAAHVVPEHRIDFLRAVGAGAAPLRFTEYQVLAVQLGPTSGEARALVSFRLHQTATLREVGISDDQRWSYDARARRWRVTPDLASYRDVAGR